MPRNTYWTSTGNDVFTGPWFQTSTNGHDEVTLTSGCGQHTAVIDVDDLGDAEQVVTVADPEGIEDGQPIRWMSADQLSVMTA